VPVHSSPYKLVNIKHEFENGFIVMHCSTQQMI